MKALLFSRTFPKSHPRAGDPTHFIQSMKDGMKTHTIRANTKKHFKDGDLVSMRYWSGKPYASKQIEFARCKLRLEGITLVNDGGVVSGAVPSRVLRGRHEIIRLASNDGLNADDFIMWFFPTVKKDIMSFNGDILHFVDMEFKEDE